MAERTNQEDQILIPGIKSIIRQLLVIFFGALSFFSLVVRRHALLILIGLICGLIFGYFYYAKKPTFYRVSMIVIHNELTKKTYAEILGQLDKLTTPASGKKLAKALNVTQEAASSVLAIDGKNMDDGPLRKDTSSRIKQPFKIVLTLANNNSIDTLQSSVVNYLNNSSYLKRLKDEQRKNFIQRISFIDRELIKLDSLKTEYTRFLSSSKVSATFYNNAFDPTDIYVHSYTLVNQREALLNQINIDGTAVSVIDGFKTTSSPQSASLIKYLFLFAGIGFFAAFFTGFLIETKKIISKN
jgi:hypothetical protein